MRLIAKAIGMARARFYCSGRTTVQYIQDYASVIFLAHTVYSSADEHRNWSRSPLKFLHPEPPLV